MPEIKKILDYKQINAYMRIQVIKFSIIVLIQLLLFPTKRFSLSTNVILNNACDENL
jgi:hypothetical protein